MSVTFTQLKKEEAQERARGISKEMLDEYKKYITDLNVGSVGTLEFTADENVNLARTALKQAATDLNQHIRVRKPIKPGNVIYIERLSDEELNEMEKAMKNGTKTPSKPKEVAKK